MIWTALCLLMLQQTPPPPYTGPPAKPAAASQETKPAATPAPTAAPAPAPVPVAAPAPPPAAGADELLQIRTVYILRMSRAFDQYLATHLTRGGVVQVVTDPHKADAVLTEQLGRNFEDEMEELFPKPKAPAPLPEEKTDEDQPGSIATRLDMQDPEGRPRSTFGRGRGTVFLVSRGTGNVVWSTYLRPKSPSADVMNDAARLVADEIKDAYKKRQSALLKQASGGK